MSKTKVENAYVKQWVPVATIHLPLSSDAMGRLADVFRAERPGKQLYAASNEDDGDDRVEIGYYTYTEA